jgi:esterase/lipase
MKKIKTKKEIISGVFGEKKQKINFYLTESSNKVFFFIHGLYGSCFKDKYFLLAKKLVNHHFNVFLFDRSRRKGYNDKLDYKIKSSFFKEKSFKDEINDTKLAFKFLLSFLSKNKEINIVGFSLGGTLASFLIKDYQKYIKNIFLFGSGITTKDKKRPIVNSYPKKETVLKNFSMFKGKIILVQGTDDNVVSLEESREIITNENNSSLIRKLIILKDVDHQFKYLKGRENKKIAETILDILVNET